MTKHQTSTAAHPMTPFWAEDGREYQRRADVTMREWFAYVNEAPTTLDQERYWVALWLGRLEPDTLTLAPEERSARAAEVLGDMSTDDYFRVRDSLFLSIMNPAQQRPARAEEGTS